MKKLELKHLELDAGKQFIPDLFDTDFSFVAPFRITVTLGLGFEENDAMSYYQLNIVSRGMDDLPENGVFIVDACDNITVIKIIQDVLDLANLSAFPLKEAAKHFIWEYPMEVYP